ALLRLADAAALGAIYAHRCPVHPKDRKVRRSARSTHRYIPFHPIDDIEDLISLKEGKHMIALEITHQSLPYHKFEPGEENILLVIGHEKEGVSAPVLSLCDAAIHIPMQGLNTSMNVAMATAIAVYKLLEGMKKLSD
ncbi:MAG: TrmH family RNA methyltransferase, partial [Saprospiraceae bacterium]|nr:TrmH family RNA methyltransferase [Saprospiraceae bacterium]